MAILIIGQARAANIAWNKRVQSLNGKYPSMTSYSGGPQKGESGGAPSKRGGGGGSSKVEVGSGSQNRETCIRLGHDSKQS